MNIASVIVDIPTQALDIPYSYAVPDEMLVGEGGRPAAVGCAVLVTLGGRKAVGYVVGLEEVVPSPDEGTDLWGTPQSAADLKQVEAVLSAPFFDEEGAACALWLADRYAAPLAECVRLFTPPRAVPRIVRGRDGRWRIEEPAIGEVDDRWVTRGPAFAAFVPRKNAVKQQEVLAAVGAGDVRVAELSREFGAVGSTLKALAAKGAVTVERRRRMRGMEDGASRAGTPAGGAAAPAPSAAPQLTEGQKAAVAAIEAAQAAGDGRVVLVDGVTGSGKTEVYLDAIERALAGGRGAIVLVPEISLTAQTVGRFRSRFGEDVAVLHSRLSTGERFDQWDLVRRGQAHVVVGARSALFAPLADPGLIIIDEEHEASYKQDSSPRYHAREVAARMAAERGCALVLGGATPSLESLARCRAGHFLGRPWTRVSMPERPAGAVLPKVTIVDMAEQFRGGRRGVFSAPLAHALEGVCERREKAVLLLNRRGFANFLMCRECGCVPECPHCSCALTYHERTHSLMCHTCGRAWPVRAYPDPSTCCPNCGSRYMGAYGVGTQRVEDELHALLPEGVEVIRMDADTTRTKGAHQRLLEQFDAAECAVLVGTQMIAKGLDFPEVTLVGVINADTMLKLPDFRASERTYDLLEQVAGRAGRGGRPGEVVVQTYWATHPAMQAVLLHDRSVFLAAELEEREDAGYPPFSRLGNVTLWGRDERAVRQASDGMAAALREQVGARAGWEVLGPTDCVKARVKDQVRRHVMVKAPSEAALGAVLSSCAASLGRLPGINMALDVDAYDMM